MRVCLVASSYPRFENDGSARFVRSIAEAQAALGHEVYVLAPYTPEVRPYPSAVRLHWFKYVWPTRWGVMGHGRGLHNDQRLSKASLWQAPLFGLSLALQMWRIIRRYDIELIHAHWVIPSGVLAGWMARLTGKPLFISLHGSDVYLARRRAWLGRMATSAFQQARGITACSQPLADAVDGLGTSSDRVRVVPYGANPEDFDITDEVGRFKLRKRLKLTSKDQVILAVGRMVSKKGFIHLVRAMPRVLVSTPKARLVIVGEGPQRVELESLAGELGLNGKVIMPGVASWSEIATYLAASDVFVMPSIHDEAGNLDGLPNVILEAMAAARPVVATSLGGIPTAVEHGKTGLIVPEADPNALADAVIRLLDDKEERESMGHASRNRIEHDLNWVSLARQFDEMYHEQREL